MPKATAAERIAQAAADVAAIADPAEQALVATKALAALAGAGISLKETRHKATEKLKADGWTLAQLGEHLGMSRSRAQQVVGGLSRSTASRSTPASKRGGTSAEAASS